MQITYSFRIYPTLEQAAKLNDWLSLCRKLYNLALEERQTRWKTEKKSISYKDQQNKLPAFKKEHPEYKEVHSQVLQDALRRVDTAYKNFLPAGPATRVSKAETVILPLPIHKWTKLAAFLPN